MNAFAHPSGLKRVIGSFRDDLGVLAASYEHVVPGRESPAVGSRLAAAIEEARGKPAQDGQAWLSPLRRRKPRWGSPGLS